MCKVIYWVNDDKLTTDSIKFYKTFVLFFFFFDCCTLGASNTS